MADALLLALAFLTALLGVVLIKRSDQQWRDRNRKTYSLSFPADLPAEQVTAWLHSISGTLRTGPLRLTGVPTFAFEVYATSRGLSHKMKVPWQQADYIIAQLRALVPGVRVTPEPWSPPPTWTRAVELGESDPRRTLRITSPAALSASLLASMQALGDDEAVLLQWVVTAAIPERPPAREREQQPSTVLTVLVGPSNATADEVHDRREKLKETNVLGVLRLAAKAKTDARADHLIHKVRSALASVRSPDNRFRKRLVPRDTLLRRVNQAAGSLLFPAQLSVTELASLIAWPIDSPHVAGLPTGQAQHLPTPGSVAVTGRIIADSNFPGGERPIAVSVVDSCKHFHICGRTGSGKSVLMANLMAQDMQAGRGVVCVESKGDLFHAALSYIPKNRIQDVVVFDVADPFYPVSFNILSQGSPEIVASEVQAIFNHIYGAEGVRMPEALYHGLMTLMTTKAGNGPFTFVDLMPLLWPMSREDRIFSDEVTRGVKDPYIRSFWQNIDNLSRSERDKYFQALRSRIWQLNSRAEIRNIIGQSQSSFDIRDIVAKRKILLVNLAGLPDESASLIGSLLINSLWHAIKDGLASQDNPVSLFLDEFHHFVHAPISPETMLAEARSFGLAMHLAHQGLDQLRVSALRSAVMNNAVNKVVFQRGADDSRAFAAEFGPPVKEDDLKRLRAYEVVSRVASDDGISPPITGVTRAPMKPEGHAQLAVVASRARHGRKVSEVEAEIRQRRTINRSAGLTKPRLGDEDWSP